MNWGRGFCSKHYQRFMRHGDPSIGRDFAGEKNPAWKGESASYDAVHLRVRAARGPASQHVCVDCGGPAEEWSYDHADPDEKSETRGNSLVTFSTDLVHYVPRCVRDHRAYDRDKEMAHV